jgi:cobalamin biosynthesis Mg chelatase CobN
VRLRLLLRRLVRRLRTRGMWPTMIAVVKESLGQLVTDGRQTGRVVMLIKYAIMLDSAAIRVELEPATNGRPPVDVVVRADDTSWRRVDE